MRRPDVIILGAGAAGLAAARVLSEAGRSGVILEARARIGGRILTVRDAGARMPIELGAEFIHGRPDSTWQAVRRAGLTAYDVPFEHWERRAGRLAHLHDFSDELGNVMGGLARLRGPDISFAEYLRTHRRGPGLAGARRLATSFVQGFDAADPERISARSLAEEQEGLGDVGGEMQFRLLDGYGALVEHLRASVDPARMQIRLNSTVSEVRWKRSGVEVVCGGARASTIEAPRAIITLPVGVLQVPPESPGAVRFTPDIPAKRRALNQLASGPVVKAILLFREPFWEDGKVIRAARADDGLKDASFLHDPDAPFPTWWAPRPLRLPVLTGWAGGPKAVALSGIGRRQLLERALESLSAIFRLPRKRLLACIRRMHARDWAADPFSRGAYSYTTVGGSRARAALAAPIDGTLFFAGEATDIQGEASTVAGALASGERAAREVLRR